MRRWFRQNDRPESRSHRSEESFNTLLGVRSRPQTPQRNVGAAYLLQFDYKRLRFIRLDAPSNRASWVNSVVEEGWWIFVRCIRNSNVAEHEVPRPSLP